jgi:hypothetical protein
LKRIVCDTGPILHLFEANLLSLLETAGEILVPPGVASELESVAPNLRIFSAVRRSGFPRAF